MARQDQQTSGASTAAALGGRRRRTSLAARGQPAVWLTGGAAALSVLMIVGLFVLVGVYGFGTFWPQPVERVTYEAKGMNGPATIVGEAFRHDVQFVNEELAGPNDSDGQPTPLDINDDGLIEPQAAIDLTLWRTGNRDLDTGTSNFAWVPDYAVSGKELPNDVLIVERQVDGRAIGRLDAVAIDGRLYEGFDAAWPAMQSVLGDVRELGRRIEAIKSERGNIGEDRKVIEDRLAAATGEDLDNDAERPDVSQEDVARAVERSITETAELQERDRNLVAEQTTLEAEVSRYRLFLRDESGQILSASRTGRTFNVSARTVLPADVASNVVGVKLIDFDGNTTPADPTTPIMGLESMASQAQKPGAVVIKPKGDTRPALQFVDASGNDVGEPYLLAPRAIVVVTDGEAVAAGKRVAIEPLAMTIGQVVHAYPPNQLGFFGKLGVYGSRWWEFLTDNPRDANMEGGVWPHIVGTVLLTFIMIVFVVPIGVIAAIYLREYARQGPLVSLVRICVNNLAGVPSIVYGVFGLGFFCYGVGGWIDGGAAGAGVSPLAVETWVLWLGIAVVATAIAIGLGSLAARADKGAASDESTLPKLFRFAAAAAWAASAAIVFYYVIASIPTDLFGGFFPDTVASGSSEWKGQALLWASLTLALLTLPVVIVATEEALAAVPRSMREGSYACGASKWQTIFRIVLPRAMPGIMTGAILAIARGAGEVAPIMLVGALKNVGDLPLNTEAPYVHLDQAFMHLGFHIFDLGFQSPDAEAARSMVYTTTLLLIVIVLMLNLTAIWLRSRLRRAFAGGAF